MKNGKAPVKFILLLLNKAFGGVEDMLLESDGNKERLFLALDKGGVYEVIVQD